MTLCGRGLVKIILTSQTARKISPIHSRTIPSFPPMPSHIRHSLIKVTLAQPLVAPAFLVYEEGGWFISASISWYCSRVISPRA
jgi:hypothetical protein